jgi:pimeloyl-ACP methyl ester carboxylesterase
MEKPVTFVNRNGSRLFGMLYLPDIPQPRRVGIVISVNAVKYRLGTFRLHVLLARKLCELGYTVFSFDPEGIGDSEGRFDYKLLSEHYYDIQTGKYDRDLHDAIEFFGAQGPFDSLLLLGLCGGAISVLMEAAGDRRVDGLVLLNIPVLLEGLSRRGQADNAAMITSSRTATKLLKSKLRRFVEADFWKGVARFQVDVREEGRLVGRALAVLAQRMGVKAASLVGGRGRVRELRNPVSSNKLFNMRFQNSFARLMRTQTQIFFLFAEHDPWTWIFKSEFQDHVLQPGNAFEGRYEIDIIAAANHIFSARESQVRLQQRVVRWLETHFPVCAQ